MGDFFHGWRRKSGLMTLIWACACITGWVRSHSYVDFVWYPSSTFGYSVESLHGGIRLTRGTPVASQMPIQFGSENLGLPPHVKFDENGKPLPNDPWEKLDAQWRSDWLGFSFGAARIKNTNSRIEMGIIPYWSIAAPLTLVSAYLLLRAPRKSSRETTTIPCPPEEA